LLLAVRYPPRQCPDLRARPPRATPPPTLHLLRPSSFLAPRTASGLVPRGRVGRHALLLSPLLCPAWLDLKAPAILAAARCSPLLCPACSLGLYRRFARRGTRGTGGPRFLAAGFPRASVPGLRFRVGGVEAPLPPPRGGRRERWLGSRFAPQRGKPLLPDNPFRDSLRLVSLVSPARDCAYNAELPPT